VLTLVFLPALYMVVFGREDRLAQRSSGAASGAV
jgi:hypothetical protein